MRIKIALIATALMMILTGCGETESSSSSESEAAQTTETEADILETEAEIESAVETETEANAEATFAVQAEDFTPVEGLSEKYGDLDNRSFAYDGKIYTLGESTLKDLIDGGIPFNENDLNNKGNNVNKNYETSQYDVEINDYAHMQFSFINITDGNLTEEECLLKYVRYYNLYVPQADYDESMNQEIINSMNDAATHLCFSFPLTLTKDQLLENNGDATEIDENNNVKYYIDSEVYMGSSGYYFDFDENTNQMKEVGISWLP